MPNLVAVGVEPVVFVLGDTWRRRALVVGGGVAFGAVLAAVAAAPSFAVLLVAFSVLAPASGAFVSLSQATLMDLAPAERERNMTRWTIAGGVGALAGPVLLGGAVALELGWRALFAGFAVTALALACVVARRPFPARPTIGGRSRAREVVGALRRREVVRSLVLLQTSDLLLDVLLAFVALYLVDEVGAGAGEAGAAVAAWTAAGLVGGIAILWLLRRVSGARYLRASAAVAGALFVVFLAVPGVALKLAALVLLGIVNAGWYPVLKARLYAAMPDRSGTALMLGSLADLPAAFVPLALGLAAERWGLGTALWLLLAAPVALLVLTPRPEGAAPLESARNEPPV